MGVQVGEGNTQITYSYARPAWTDTPPPLVTVSGFVESPYRGLNSYDERDAALFFGRANACDDVLGRMAELAEPALLMVSGVSGAGKSSLLQAGILPRMRGEGLPGRPDATAWPWKQMLYGSDFRGQHRASRQQRRPQYPYRRVGDDRRMAEPLHDSSPTASTGGERTGGPDRADLVRRFEPVIRFTAGELFFPMPVEAYVGHSALWERTPGVRRPVRVVDHGELDLETLCRAARSGTESALELRYVPRPLNRGESKQWRRDPNRVRFRSTSRFAAVGLLGRVLDSLFRLSLVLRGAVPGGLTAALHREYSKSPAASKFPYYAHVSDHAGYVVIQYWFFYAMNDWRSTFGGVNDHEADWEQVSVFLVPDPPAGDTATAHSADGHRVAWVAFSSHDEVGDDLRRRADDPDIEWVDGLHPVVYAGAGSHSGAYLPGEYLVRVEPPALRPVLHGLARFRGFIFPWTRDRPRMGLGIPFIDYKRGDGVRIGPDADHPWTPVIIDDRDPWVGQFQGLWGLDTTDPFGGERAPAGPRYERNGTIRPCWADPVGWAGLDKVPATPERLAEAAAAREFELGREIDRLTTEIDASEGRLQALAVGAAALPSTVAGGRRGGIGATARVREQERSAEALRSQRRAAVIEREHLARQLQDPPVTPPHAHLRHRTLPDVSPARPPGLLLRFWTEISLSVLLALLGLAVLFDYSSLWSATITAILIVTTVEAVLRRRLPIFILGLAVLTTIVVLVIILFTNLRVGVGILAVLAALVILVANIRANVGRR